jgi:hypothetical protein
MRVPVGEAHEVGGAMIGVQWMEASHGLRWEGGGLARWRQNAHRPAMTMRLALLTLALFGCHGAAQREPESAPQRTALMDSSTVRRLCAEPDSVLAGRRSCVLLDQRLIPRKIY